MFWFEGLWRGRFWRRRQLKQEKFKYRVDMKKKCSIKVFNHFITFFYDLLQIETALLEIEIHTLTQSRFRAGWSRFLGRVVSISNRAVSNSGKALGGHFWEKSLKRIDTFIQYNLCSNFVRLKFVIIIKAIQHIRFKLKNKDLQY